MEKSTKQLLHSLCLALIVKTLIVIAILLSFYLFSDFGNVPNLWNRWYTGADDLSSWYIPFANWDGQYYLLLSDWGYDYAGTIDSPRAFFPLYPMIIRALGIVFPHTLAGAIVSLLTTVWFCYFLYKIGHHMGCRSPHLGILILLSFPTAFYTSAFYTEGLYLFLQLGFVYHFLVTRSRQVWIYAALLPLTRGTALFVAVGVLAYMLLAYFQQVRDTARSLPNKAAGFDWDFYLGCFSAFLIGGILYLTFFMVTTGDPFSGIDGQATFAVNSISNLLNPGHFWSYLMSDSTGWFGARNSLFDKAFVIASILCCVAFVLAKEWGLLCFYLPLVYGQAAMGIGVSFPRFWLVAVPFLGLALTRHLKHEWIIYTGCAVMLLFQLFLLHKFSLNLWIA